ncbi:MAG: hypothetical protein ACREAU_10185, partial [Nitrosopumilaceae archaeon]
MNPVIILDLSYGGLEIVRVLHKYTKVYGFYKQTESKYFEVQTILCNNKIEYASENDLLDKLLTLIQQQSEKPVLMITSDPQASFYNKHQSILKNKVLIHFPTEHAFTSLVDKDAMSKFAALHGYSIPKTTAISSLNASEIPCPCFIKPKYKDSRWKSLLKGMMCDTTNDIVEVIEGTDAELLAQEWIGGPTTNIFFSMVYVKSGKVIEQCVGRKIREWPLVAGTGTCLQQVYNPEVKDITKRFFESVQGYEGYGSLELKYNEVDN